jgi:hypothetical protein
MSTLVEVVKDQRIPTCFYKSSLDFDGMNMVNLLSFDSRCMAFLLEDQYVDSIDKKHPIFYKNKLPKTGSSKSNPKYFYRNSVENALKSNQVGAIESILKYIVKHQNNFISGFMLTKVIPNLI